MKARVSVVKQRKSITEELVQDELQKFESQSSPDFKDWWEEKIWRLNQWLEASPVLPEDGCFETIRQQMERGSNYETIQMRCWQHIVLELDALAESGALSLSRSRDGRDQQTSPDSTDGSSHSEGPPRSSHSEGRPRASSLLRTLRASPPPAAAAVAVAAVAAAVAVPRGGAAAAAGRPPRPGPAPVPPMEPSPGRNCRLRAAAGHRGSGESDLDTSKDGFAAESEGGAAAAAAAARRPEDRPRSGSLASLDSIGESIEAAAAADGEEAEAPAVVLAPGGGGSGAGAEEGPAGGGGGGAAESSFLARQREFAERKRAKAEARRREQRGREEAQLTFQPEGLARSRRSWGAARRENNPSLERLPSQGGGERPSRESSCDAGTKKPPAAISRQSSMASTATRDAGTAKGKGGRRGSSPSVGGAASAGGRNRRQSTGTVPRPVKTGVSFKSTDDLDADNQQNIKSPIKKRTPKGNGAPTLKDILNKNPGFSRSEGSALTNEIQASIDKLRRTSQDAVEVASPGGAARRRGAGGGGGSSRPGSPSPADGGVDGDGRRIEDEGVVEEQPPEPIEVKAPNPDEYIPGKFFTKIDGSARKGHFKIREPEHFQLTSMYKRKDRVTRQIGLSLLVGKLEKPPHQEKVISFLYDLDEFDERGAHAWWVANRHRFQDFDPQLSKEIRSPGTGTREQEA